MDRMLAWHNPKKTDMIKTSAFKPLLKNEMTVSMYEAISISLLTLVPRPTCRTNNNSLTHSRWNRNLDCFWSWWCLSSCPRKRQNQNRNHSKRNNSLWINRRRTVCTKPWHQLVLYRQSDWKRHWKSLQQPPSPYFPPRSHIYGWPASQKRLLSSKHESCSKGKSNECKK